jgi:hypothetical protein
MFVVLKRLQKFSLDPYFCLPVPVVLCRRRMLVHDVQADVCFWTQGRKIGPSYFTARTPSAAALLERRLLTSALVG